MLVKYVIKGYQSKYDIEELTIINQDKILFSGNINGYINPQGFMTNYKKAIDNSDVINSQTISGSKLFLFI